MHKVLSKEGNNDIYGYARAAPTGKSQLAGSRASCRRRSQGVQRKGIGFEDRSAELAKLIKRLEPGDVVIVTRLDRLARSTRDLLNVLATVGEHEAGLRSLKDAWADTTTPHGRLMLTVLGGLAEFERELIRARTGEGRSPRQGPWCALRPSGCSHATPAGRSPTAPWQWRSAGGCSAVIQRLAGNDLAACSLVPDLA